MTVRKRNSKKSEKGQKAEVVHATKIARTWFNWQIIILIGVFSLLLCFLINSNNNGSNDILMNQNLKYTPGPAIVTTWKGVSRDWADSWVKYHAAVGFTRLFIFWDDPKHDKETIDYIQHEYPWVVDNYIPDREYKMKYWMPNQTSDDYEQKVLPAYGVHADTEITARQSLYAVRAAQVGAAEGVTWLLHIDADELFYVDTNILDGSAAKVFNNLSKQKFTHASFFNDEILPESAKYVDQKQLKTPFHQRTLFKRNTAVTFRNEQHQVREEWKAMKGVNFFMGYLCGKGAINIPEYLQRNPGRKIVTQHVVRFSSDDRNLELVRKLQDSREYVHFEVPTDKYSNVAYFYHARILHYINSDIDSARSKFSSREKFETKIFDTNLATEEVRDRYELWREKWTKEEGMPSEEYYNSMWKAVQAEKRSGGNDAEKYYLKTSVITDKRQRNRFIQFGLIYRNEKIRDYLNKITKEIDDSNGNGVEVLKGLSKYISDTPNPKLYVCSRGPHYKCDHKDCCFHLRSPMFTFEKRLIGYVRYEAFEWWKQGLTWPPRN